MDYKSRGTHTRTQGSDAVARVALYLRDIEGVVLRTFVASRSDWQISATYRDHGPSAAVMRPGLEKALAAARPSQYDVLVVLNLAQLTRRMSDLTRILDDLARAGIAVCSATEPFDTSSPFGRFLAKMLTISLDFEREQNAAMTRAGTQRPLQ
jgi:DNA invertase Pin-like site-specific DNA recombinase